VFHLTERWRLHRSAQERTAATTVAAQMPMVEIQQAVSSIGLPIGPRTLQLKAY
jgi:hypothetical protein